MPKVRKLRNEFDPEEESYRGVVQSGAVVTGSSQAVVALSQIASVIVLSRLLSPADFGIVAMSWPVIGLLSIFQDFGLTQATVQRPSLSRSDVNFLFWSNLAISALVAAAVFAVAPLAVAFYGEPAVGPLLQAMSVLILIQGLGAQHSALLNRRMRFKAMAGIEVAGAVAGLFAAIAWALVDPSYWALFAGSLVTVLLPAGLAWTLSGWRPGLPRSTSEASGLMHFGAGVTGFNLFNFLARNGDNILIGRYLGEISLGLYDRAYKLMLMPLRQATNPLARVMIPTLSRLTDDPERYRKAYLTVLPLLLVALLPGVAAMIVVAPDFVPFLLGARWQESATIFSALGFAAMLQPLNNPAGWLFISQGRSRHFMHWGFVTAVTSIAAFAFGLPYGALGVAVAYAISEYLRTPLLWWYIGREGAIGPRHILAAAGPILLAGHLALVVCWLLQPYMPAHPLLQAAATAIAAYAFVVPVVLLFPTGREMLHTVIGLVPLTWRKAAGLGSH